MTNDDMSCSWRSCTQQGDSGFIPERSLSGNRAADWLVSGGTDVEINLRVTPVAICTVQEGPGAFGTRTSLPCLRAEREMRDLTREDVKIGSTQPFQAVSSVMRGTVSRLQSQDSVIPCFLPSQLAVESLAVSF